jgi:hypothetical protein
MRAQLGHDGPPTNIYVENLVTGAPLVECPLRTVLRARESNPVLTREIDRYLDEHYPNYEAGHLLTSGGTADQPSRYIGFMALIASVRAKQQVQWTEITNPDPSASAGDA